MPLECSAVAARRSSGRRADSAEVLCRELPLPSRVEHPLPSRSACQRALAGESHGAARRRRDDAVRGRRAFLGRDLLSEACPPVTAAASERRRPGRERPRRRADRRGPRPPGGHARRRRARPGAVLNRWAPREALVRCVDRPLDPAFVRLAAQGDDGRTGVVRRRYAVMEGLRTGARAGTRSLAARRSRSGRPRLLGEEAHAADLADIPPRTRGERRGQGGDRARRAGGRPRPPSRCGRQRIGT